ncbi:hypothetical protein CRE_06015 [Caenorhabditis remanei]|uniref:Fas-binding factor 1 C-terminal domain-containing protein n=1 Tax=Caenorhabditis remanei TaxID=31234 RepID=E3N6H9_CAERE|nr:hypothetical protein CRE_06015 [Caenorhabditis remanei]
MSDDEWGDLLEGLDNEPPPPPPETKPAAGNQKGTPARQRSGLDSFLSSGGGADKTPPTAKKEVNFSIAPKEEEMRSVARSTNALNDLFGPSTSLSTPATSTAPPRRAGGGTSTLDDIFGTAPRAPATAATPQVSQPTATTAPPPSDNFDAGRVLRLEAELERVNRELEDTKRKKREDEEDLENFWKTKLEVQARDHSKLLEDVRNSHKTQITKLQEEHHVELERIKTNFERQLDSVTSSTSQVGDLVSVVGKVDSISMNIDRIAADVVATTNKVSSEQAALLQLQEERLKIREEKLADDTAALRTEQLKVHELNLSLKDLVKNQQDENEREKWRTKEEWNRLKVEKQIFKENQDRIIGNIEKEKQQLAEELKAFRKNQNDLLFRVSTERELLEQERNEFLAKRDQDIKRIKSEAYELDIKSQQVTTADQHVAEMKLITETKYRQVGF